RRPLSARPPVGRAGPGCSRARGSPAGLPQLLRRRPDRRFARAGRGARRSASRRAGGARDALRHDRSIALAAPRAARDLSRSRPDLGGLRTDRDGAREPRLVQPGRGPRLTGARGDHPSSRRSRLLHALRHRPRAAPPARPAAGVRGLRLPAAALHGGGARAAGHDRNGRRRARRRHRSLASRASLKGRRERAPTGGGDARRLVGVRALRGFVDGLVSVLLAGYLTRLGFTPLEVGAIVTGTLLGSAALTVTLGLAGHGLSRRRVLLGAAALMFATGLGFAGFTDFWPLLVVAVLGTLNPSSGDVSVFLPTEQAVLAEIAPAQHRTRLFASYNVSGDFMGALGGLASGVPVVVARAYDLEVVSAERGGFLIYALVAVVTCILSWGPGPEVEMRLVARAGPLGESRKIVVQLAALFSLDSFGGGFAIQSLLVLWLHQRFHLSAEVTGAVFFAAGALGGLSQLVSPILAARIGLVPTMVYTHLPANFFLIAAGLVPSAPLAVVFLLL